MMCVTTSLPQVTENSTPCPLGQSRRAMTSIAPARSPLGTILTLAFSEPDMTCSVGWHPLHETNEEAPTNREVLPVNRGA